MVLVSIALLSLLRSESDSGKAYIPLGLEDQEDLEILKRVLVIRWDNFSMTSFTKKSW